MAYFHMLLRQQLCKAALFEDVNSNRLMNLVYLPISSLVFPGGVSTTRLSS